MSKKLTVNAADLKPGQRAYLLKRIDEMAIKVAHEANRTADRDTARDARDEAIRAWRRGLADKSLLIIVRKKLASLAADPESRRQLVLHLVNLCLPESEIMRLSGADKIKVPKFLHGVSDLPGVQQLKDEVMLGEGVSLADVEARLAKVIHDAVYGG